MRRMVQLAAVALCLAWPAMAEEVKPAAAVPAPALDLSALNAKDTDIALGDEKAPVTIVEYASLSCPHCAKFHTETLPVLKEKYIDTGKVRFIFRNFPLNAPALRGAMLTHCVPKGDAHTFLKVLFEQQSTWAFDKDFTELLGKIARLGGVSHEDFAACMKNEALENQLLALKKEAIEKLQVHSTPTFFINGQKVQPADAGGFSAIIDPLVK